MKTYLGIDWGKKRIGLALADDETKLATPFKVVANISELMKIIADEEVESLVVGSPVNLSGNPSANADFINFLKIIEEKALDLKLEVVLVDERLTSVYADSLIDRKLNQKQDAVSAMIILQTYLDKKVHLDKEA